MKLLIVSHTPHYRSKNGIVGWEATIREIDFLSTLFDEVVHLAPLHDGDPPRSTAPYHSGKIIFKAVQPSGGATFAQKLSILGRVPQYVSAIRREMNSSDAIHVRCPANISMIALLLLSVNKTPKTRWLKYAGNWSPSGAEPWSYRFQRFLLKKGWHRGIVTVNGEWPDQRSYVRSFYNPSLTKEDLQSAGRISTAKHLAPPIRLLFAGRLEEAKGAGRVIEIAEILKKADLQFRVDLVGDGRDRPVYENQAKMRGLNSELFFHGWLSRASLAELYSSAHFLVLPTHSSEGWPKVISESMAYGAVPLAGAISSIPQYLNRFECGSAIDPMNVNEYAKRILDYAANPEQWKKESKNAVASAELFGYEEYLKNVRKIFNMTPNSARVESGVLEARTF